MNVQIYLPPPKDDINSNITRLNIFLSELNQLKDLFYSRLDEKLKELEDHENELEKKGIPKPIFSMNQLSDEYSDIKLNLYFKCYFFILKQAIDKILHLIYLSRDQLGFEKVNNSIPDASKPKSFSTFIKNLAENKYDFDKDILNILDENRDLLIITRILRNSLKIQGTFRVIIINGKEVTIVCPVLKRDKDDKTMNLLKTKLSVELKDLKNLTFGRSFVEQSFFSLNEIIKILNNKLDKNKNSS
jgi:hypothetical protein